MALSKYCLAFRSSPFSWQCLPKLCSITDSNSAARGTWVSASSSPGFASATRSSWRRATPRARCSTSRAVVGSLAPGPTARETCVSTTARVSSSSASNRSALRPGLASQTPAQRSAPSASASAAPCWSPLRHSASASRCAATADPRPVVALRRSPASCRPRCSRSADTSAPAASASRAASVARPPPPSLVGEAVGDRRSGDPQKASPEETSKQVLAPMTAAS
mmetsp:Transcript_110446/g.352133  ORF Transcript_110446/g.352133 Transcript_110446/m.352133 type:complete len:222 (-) Transcript_110446:25-690(-)